MSLVDLMRHFGVNEALREDHMGPNRPEMDGIRNGTGVGSSHGEGWGDGSRWGDGDGARSPLGVGMGNGSVENAFLDYPSSKFVSTEWTDNQFEAEVHRREQLRGD